MQCTKPVFVNHIVGSQKQLAKPNNGYKYNNVRIKTLNECRICISQYNFFYNAEGGKGIGRHIKNKEDEYGSHFPLSYDFDLETVHLPPLTNTTARLDGTWIMFPPFLKVEVVPQCIQGDICKRSGKVRT